MSPFLRFVQKDTLTLRGSLLYDMSGNFRPIYVGTGPWNLKLARKDQIHSNFPKYGFEAPRVHWCTRKNFWWSRGGARFCDHMIKNVDFRQYRQFLDPSLSDVPILLFKEDYDDIYRFLISRKKYFFGPKMAIFRTKIK